LTRRNFYLLILISAAAVFIALVSCIILTCAGKENPAEEAEEYLETEEQIETAEEEIIPEQEEIKEAVQSAAAPAQVSYTVSRPLSGLSGRIQGRGVNIQEIDPVNYDNPDPEILRQMGAEPYLISYFSGERFYRDGNYDRAIIEYTSSINRNGDFIDAFISRASAYMKKRDYRRAVDDYTRSIRIDGSRAELYNYRGFARAELAARGSAGEMSSAIEDFSRAISINRNYVDALINRSRAYYRTGSYDRAIEDCDRIIRLEPSNYAIWNRRGSAWYAKEDDDRAIRDFNEAIKLNANYAAAFYNRGNAWYNKRDLEKALSDLSRSIAIDPAHAAAYASRAKIHQLQGNSDLAETDLASARRLQR